MQSTLPGIERIKVRFLNLLAERQAAIAHHAVSAWESDDPAVRRTNLTNAQNLLHQISGTAGSLGFGSLGENARRCEGAILEYFARDANCAVLDESIICDIDAFVVDSQTILAEQQ